MPKAEATWSVFGPSITSELDRAFTGAKPLSALEVGSSRAVDGVIGEALATVSELHDPLRHSIVLSQDVMRGETLVQQRIFTLGVPRAVLDETVINLADISTEQQPYIDDIEKADEVIAATLPQLAYDCAFLGITRKLLGRSELDAWHSFLTQLRSFEPRWIVR